MPGGPEGGAATEEGGEGAEGGEEGVLDQPNPEEVAAAKAAEEAAVAEAARVQRDVRWGGDVDLFVLE